MEFSKKFKCAGCGDSMQIDGVSEKEVEDGFIEEGWVHIDGEDFCPKCAANQNSSSLTAKK